MKRSRLSRARSPLAHRPETPVGSTHSSKWGLRPPEQLERQAEFLPQTRRGLTLRSQLCRDPEVGGSESETPCQPCGLEVSRHYPWTGEGPALFVFHRSGATALCSLMSSPKPHPHDSTLGESSREAQSASSIATTPAESREAPPISTVSLTSHRHSEKLLEATGKSRGK